MNGKIAEKDWKHLHSLQDGLIERYCGQTLSHINHIVISRNYGDNLRRYQEIWSYIKKREKILLRDLNDFRRSNAIDKITDIYRLGLFHGDEYESFSDN